MGGAFSVSISQRKTPNPSVIDSFTAVVRQPARVA